MFRKKWVVYKMTSLMYVGTMWWKKIFVCIFGQQPKVQEIKDLYQFIKLEFLPVSVFRTKIFINTKVRKMLNLAIGKNLNWERIELPSLLYLIKIFARNLGGLHLIWCSHKVHYPRILSDSSLMVKNHTQYTLQSGGNEHSTPE